MGQHKIWCLEMETSSVILQLNEVLSELDKETVSGETSGSPCYQFFKFMVISGSHYIHKTECFGALFVSLLLRMVSCMQSLSGMTWQVLWALAGSLLWMNETVFCGASWVHPAGEHFLWAAATGNVSASNTSKDWGWLLPCLGNAGMTGRTAYWKLYVIIPDKSLVGRCLVQVFAHRVAIEYSKMQMWSRRQFCKHKAAYQMLARKSGVGSDRVDFCCGTNFSVVVPEQERRFHLG